jgi:hypothetical protein
MTYGWALLLIVLVIGALFALGVFDINAFLGSRAVGFAQVGVAAWRVDGNGNMSAQFTNRVGADIRVDNVTITYRGASTTFPVSVTIPNGQTSATVSLGNIAGLTSGTSYTLQMSISYTDLNTNFVYQSSGTLTGKAG